MLKNYLKTAFRTLYRQKLYTSINIFSLSIGIACCTLIILYVQTEFSTDRFHDNADQIYRVYRVENRVNGTTKRSAGVSAPLGPALISDMPEIKRAVRLSISDAQIERGNAVYSEQVLFSDPGFFQVFTFPMAASISTDPLADPAHIVLSTAMARKYFDRDDPVGESLRLRLGEEFEVFTVAGVVSELPSNSSIAFDFVVPFARRPDFAVIADEWTSFNSAVYVQTTVGADIASVQSNLDRLVAQYYGEIIEQYQASGWWVQGATAFDLEFQPLTDVHFSDNFTNMIASTGSIGNLYLLAGIGLIVLLLACVNFMTLAAARAERRALEVGMRKTFGAHRGQLARQFWGEALMLSIIAMIVGIGLARFALPVFNELAGTRLGLRNIGMTFSFSLIALTLFCGLVAGSYPALFLSRFRPSEVLKGEIHYGRGISVTRVLVVAQFAISTGLLVCTLVMINQMHYVQTKNLGFADDGILAVNLHADQTDEDQLLDRFRQMLDSRPEVVQITGSSYAFGDGWSRTTITEEGHQSVVYMMRTDPRYLETMGMSLIAGRNFSEALTTDREQSVLINESFAREFEWKDPVGRFLPGYEEDGVTIVGVVSDYHFQSLRDEIEPVVLHMSPSLGQIDYALLRLKTSSMISTMATIRSTWQEIAPDQPFTYEFMDQRLAALYDAEARWSRIIQIAAGFALLIACLGLFGLATLSVDRRRREVGIRKVLGASVSRVTILLAKDFSRLVGIAFLIACPPAYVLMQHWLNGFAYHADLGPAEFLSAGALVFVIAILTVTFHAVRAATSDPVQSLKRE